MDAKDIHHRLRDLRKSQKLNQTDFAHLLGVTPSYISAMELGKKDVTRKVVARLIELFKVSADWLISGNSPNGVDENEPLTGSLVNTQPELGRSMVHENRPQSSKTQKDQLERFHNKFNIELSRTDPSMRQLGVEVDLIGHMIFELIDFNDRYLAEINSSSFGPRDVIAYTDETGQLSYAEYRASMLAAIEPLSKYKELVSDVYDQMRGILKTCKPFDTESVISGFLVE